MFNKLSGPCGAEANNLAYNLHASLLRSLAASTQTSLNHVVVCMCREAAITPWGQKMSCSDRSTAQYNTRMFRGFFVLTVAHTLESDIASREGL